MTIDEYLRKERAPKAKDFATQLGISQPYLSQLRSGERKPGRALAIAIDEVTGGEVPVTIWDTPCAA